MTERTPKRRIVRRTRDQNVERQLAEYEERVEDGLVDESLSRAELDAIERRSRGLFWPKG
ncbi:MAG: hypothetical protein ABL912_01790 [Novosphingobium sp.]